MRDLESLQIKTLAFLSLRNGKQFFPFSSFSPDSRVNTLTPTRSSNAARSQYKSSSVSKASTQLCWLSLFTQNEGIKMCDHVNEKLKGAGNKFKDIFTASRCLESEVVIISCLKCDCFWRSRCACEDAWGLALDLQSKLIATRNNFSGFSRRLFPSPHQLQSPLTRAWKSERVIKYYFVREERRISPLCGWLFKRLSSGCESQPTTLSSDRFIFLKVKATRSCDYGLLNFSYCRLQSTLESSNEAKKLSTKS